MYGFGPIRATVLAVRIIPRVNPFMKEKKSSTFPTRI